VLVCLIDRAGIEVYALAAASGNGAEGGTAGSGHGSHASTCACCISIDSVPTRACSRCMWRATHSSRHCPGSVPPDLDAAPAEVAELELGSAKQRDQHPNRQSDDVEYKPDDHRYDPDDCSYHDGGIPRIVAVDSIVGGG
jgi:hypothetical protein